MHYLAILLGLGRRSWKGHCLWGLVLLGLLASFLLGRLLAAGKVASFLVGEGKELGVCALLGLSMLQVVVWFWAAFMVVMGLDCL